MSNQTKVWEDQTLPVQAVLYTDGGCHAAKPGQAASRGYAGWGMHGYFFVDEPAKVGSGCKGAFPTANGYVKGESGKTDITLLGYVDGFGALPDATNQIAEVTGVIRALKIAIDCDVTNLKLVMDSRYALEGINDYVEGWESRNWTKSDGQPYANIDYWKEALRLKREFLAREGATFECRWVKSHNGEKGDFGNELADKHATRGVITAKNHVSEEMLKVTPSKGYWNNKIERNRMFSHPNWYFSTQSTVSDRTEDGRYVYYLGDPREDDELLGKKIANATFSIIYLKEPDPVLSQVREVMESLGANQYQGPVIADLAALFNPNTYTEITEYGDKLISRDFQNQRMWVPSQSKPICREIRPARLAFQAFEAMASLEDVLKEYLSPKEGTRVERTDLTPLIYEVDTVKKKTVVKLKNTITSGTRSLKVKAKYQTAAQGVAETQLVLTLAQDMPDRNTLAALAGEKTKVTLLTWPESEHAIRYAVVVDIEQDVGIWSGIYANMHMLAKK